MWKRYVWKRESEKKKDGPYIRIISIMPVNIVAWQMVINVDIVNNGAKRRLTMQWKKLFGNW